MYMTRSAKMVVGAWVSGFIHLTVLSFFVPCRRLIFVMLRWCLSVCLLTPPPPLPENMISGNFYSPNFPGCFVLFFWVHTKFYIIFYPNFLSFFFSFCFFCHFWMFQAIFRKKKKKKSTNFFYPAKNNNAAVPSMQDSNTSLLVLPSCGCSKAQHKSSFCSIPCQSDACRCASRFVQDSPTDRNICNKHSICWKEIPQRNAQNMHKSERLGNSFGFCVFSVSVRSNSPFNLEFFVVRDLRDGYA